MHERAFRRLGGTTKVIVLDNLKEGVLTPDIYDPALNPLYQDMLTHYGVVALPARVRHPDRKGKVESSVGFAQKTPLAGKRFESLAEAQRHLDEWATRWADTRIHGTTKRQVGTFFEHAEKTALLPLPPERFANFRDARRIVHRDGHVEMAHEHMAERRFRAALLGRPVAFQRDVSGRLAPRKSGGRDRKSTRLNSSHRT